MVMISTYRCLNFHSGGSGPSYPQSTDEALQAFPPLDRRTSPAGEPCLWKGLSLKRRTRRRRGRSESGRGAVRAAGLRGSSAPGVAHLGAGDYVKATEACRCLAQVAGAEEQKAGVESLLTKIEAAGGCRRHAVLVGIDRYRSRKLPRLKGAVNDAGAIQKVLVGRWGFKPEDVTLLYDKAADRTTILAEFERLAQLSRQETALFFLAGLARRTRTVCRPSLATTAGQREWMISP